MSELASYTFDTVAKAYIENGTNKKVIVELGDSKSAENFEPQVKLKAWDNECNFSMRLVVDEQLKQSAVVTKDGDFIKWTSDDTEAHFYALGATELNENGAYEFAVLIKEKPASNIINFTLNIPKNLEFYYQGELTETEINFGATRPENIVGSYAVYHSSKKDNQYKTGKAFHIYRPEAIDANNNKSWCALNIDPEKQIATITIPQEWLDNAAYPILIDPEFGYTSAGGTGIAVSPNMIYTHGDTYMGAVSTGVSMSVYAAKGAADANVQMALYRTNATKVTNGSTPSVLVNNTARWWTSNFTTPPVLAAEGYYLILNQETALYYAYDVAGTNNVIYAAQTFNVWPSPMYGDDGGARYKISIYCTYMVKPVISIQSYTRTKISAITGVDSSTVTFRSDLALQAWEARAGGSGQGQGLLVGSGTTLAANTDQQFVVDDSELTSGDGAYQINIYGQNTNGDWSTYG